MRALEVLGDVHREVYRQIRCNPLSPGLYHGDALRLRSGVERIIAHLEIGSAHDLPERERWVMVAALIVNELARENGPR